METISNIASNATTTVSTLIYGEQNNETAGKEPVSGHQGQGTATDPYDHGNLPTPMQPSFQDKSPVSGPSKATAENDFLKLTPVVNAPKNEEDAPKAQTDTEEKTDTGLTILPLTDATTEGVNAPTAPTPAAEVTETAEAKDKEWKETSLDDISAQELQALALPRLTQLLRQQPLTLLLLLLRRLTWLLPLPRSHSFPALT